VQKSKIMANSIISVLFCMLAWTAQSEPTNDKLDRIFENAGKGQYSQAIEALKQTIEENGKSAVLYLLLADYSWYTGDLEGARQYFLQKIAEDSTHSNHYLGLAQLAKHNDNWQEALAHCKRALTLQSSVPAAIELLVESALQLDDTNALSRALTALKQNDSQKHLYELGYAFWRFRIGNLRSAQSTISGYLKNNETDAFGHLVAGLIAQQRGNLEEANTHFHKALAVLSASDIFELIVIYENLGVNHFKTDRADSAKYYFSQAHEWANRVGALQHEFDVARAAIPFYRELALYQRLADASATAISIARKLDLKTDLNVLLYEYGFAHEKMHDHSRALQYYGDLLNRLKKSDSDNELMAKTTLNMGRIWFDLNDETTALHHLETCIKMAERHGWRDLENQARLVTGDIYRERGDFEEARKRYQDVLRYGQRTQQHDITETCFLKLAHLYLEPENRNFNNAYYFLSLADALARQTVQLQFAAKHRWMEGRMALLEGNIERAEMLFLDAVEMGRETGSYISVLAGHAGLIRTYLQGQFPELASNHADSVFYYLDDFSERSEFFDLKKEVFEPAITAYSNVGELGKIYDTCERYKAFRHAIALEQVKYKIQSTAFDSLNWEIDLAKRRIQKRWEDLWDTWSDHRDHIELTTEIKQEIREMQIDKTRHLSFIARQYPDYYALVKPVPQPLLRLQTQLKKLNAVFLHYMVSANATFIIMVTADSLACKRVNITDSFLNDRVTGLNPMFKNESAGASSMEAFRMDYAGELYKLLFEPVRSWIPENHKIIISPDGALNQLPFECLVTNPEELTDEYDYIHARFLVEDYVISYIPFARLLKPQDKDRFGRTDPVLLALANSNTTRPLPTNGADTTNGTSHNRMERVREVERIVEIVGEGDARVYLEQEATKRHFLKDSGSYKLIHLALPTVLNGDHPLYSEIQFADGAYLNAANLFNLDLNAWTMLLSAAKQSRRDVSSEGLYGMFHGLQFAGIPTLVSTRWEPEHNDSELIAAFYSNLMDGMGQAEALQQAKVNFLNTTDRNPYYWAPLMLLGYPGKVRLQTAAIEVIVFLTGIGVTILLGVITWKILKMKNESRLSQAET